MTRPSRTTTSMRARHGPSDNSPPPSAMHPCAGESRPGSGDSPHATTFAFLQLPRELRDQIYSHTFNLRDDRSERALRVERRNLKYFKPSPATILLVLHHEYFLLNRQIAREALEVLFKHHSVFFSCGPFVLKALLERIEQEKGPGRQWLRWIRSIELDWVTFPNLNLYPPDREDGGDKWSCEQEEEDLGVDIDYIRGAQNNGHFDEYDHEGGHYDDNLYDPAGTSLYPSFRWPTAVQTDNTNDPFDFANHYPFVDPSRGPIREPSAEDTATKLKLLVSLEVTPLFTYLASPTFNITSITLPLYFISKQSHHQRNTARPGCALPLKIRYWVQVCTYALLMLRAARAPGTPGSPPLQHVRIKYLPWDIWASMDPADDLRRILDKGIWFDGPDDAEGGPRESEGEAFRAVWAGIRAHLSPEERAEPRLRLAADIRFVPWDGNVDSWRVGDELEVLCTRASEAEGK